MSAKCGICSVSSFDQHPHLARILMPRTWSGHPLRKDHPARARRRWDLLSCRMKSRTSNRKALQFRPEEWGMCRDKRDGSDFIFLNVGPQHPGTHGVSAHHSRIGWRRDCRCRAGDRLSSPRRRKDGASGRTWHTYIPYTDRVDYLGGVMNNLAYLSAVEKLAGITVPSAADR